LLPSLPADLPAGRVMRVPLSYQDFVEPGAPVDVSKNPMIPNVRVVDARQSPGEQSPPTEWLLDTGGSVSIVGEDLARAIGIDLDNEVPTQLVDVIGVGGEQRTFFGYNVDELIVPLTGSDELIFEDIVLFVPESGALPADLPGIFGMNLIGQSFSMQDAFGFPSDTTESPFSDWYIDPFDSQLVLVDTSVPVPEPSSAVLLAIGAMALLFVRRRMRR